MNHFTLNRKGQFSIIAALSVAVILISSVMVTYSTIRYNTSVAQPQIMNAVDETNLALKQVLGFTVGYYGSIMQVTGNSSYAYTQSQNYLQSGLNNIVALNPSWDTSFKVNALSLGTTWFTNSSNSQGSLDATYDLPGLGVYNITYSISAKLGVQVLHSSSKNQVSLTVTQDSNQPDVTLSKSNFKFYQYQDSNLTWGMVSPPEDPIVSSDGTYTLTIPSGITPQSFIIQVQDQRGIMVAASSFSHYTGAITFNGTTSGAGNYVNLKDVAVDGSSDQGTHSNFTVQQTQPKGTYDSLTEANLGTNNQNYHPSNYALDGSTTLVAGTPANLASDDGSYMTFGSYVSSTSSQTLYSHQSTTSVGGTNYYTYTTSGAASSGLTLTGSMSSSSALLGNAVYGLQGISSLPANTWTFNYRAWKDVGTTVTYDAQSSTTYAGGSTSFSWSVNVGNGNNRLLLVTVSVYKGAGSAPATVTSVTYNGATMSQYATGVYTSGSNPQVRSYIFYLINPTHGNKNVQVTMSASSIAVGGAVAYANVNQAAPLLAQAASQNYGSSQSVSISSTAWGQAVYASIGCYGASAYTLTSNAGQTVRWIQTGQTYKGHGDDVLNPAIGAVNPGWQTGATTVGYVCLAVLINPAATTAVGNIDATILIRTSTGSVRQTIASNVAVSGALTTTPTTLSGTYNFQTYNVVSQSDYLEIDYYVSASTQDNSNGHLRIDDDTLSTSQQTSVANVLIPGQYTCQMELSGSSNLNNWNNLLWQIDTDATVANANAVFQLYDYGASSYHSSGNGYFTATLSTSIQPYSQSFSSSPNPTQFRDSISDWKMKITVTSSAPFNVNVDSTTFQSGVANFGVSLEEQWTNLNTTLLTHPALCIYAGNVAAGNLAVQAWFGNSWQTITSGLSTGWNNMSINSFVTSGQTTFTIRLYKTGDSAQNSWQVSSALIRPESDLDLFNSLNNPSASIAVEILQNGTMVWLGQNLEITTQTIPIPPVPVKALHVNETINGENQQVPFQIEDWASDYTVPLGLTNNATVFGNRQMVVFLVNTHVTAFTLWWNGSSQAVQTPFAFVDKYFTGDNPNSNFLTNGKLKVQFGSPFTATSTVIDSGTSSSASFMQVNNQASGYGSGADYVIYNGVVRDIIHQEAEWSGGVNNCPNFYANIVLTLPANATYFTYQLSLMFLSSTPQRTISQLCPIALTSSINQIQTENGISEGDPIVASGTNTFSSTPTWVHHWSQFSNGNTGAGIMFADAYNHALYAFDTMPASTSRGALSASLATQTISLLPVTLNPVSFQKAYDISWSGAVVTFDNSVPPIYNGVQPGLWVLAEMPPLIAVTVGN